MKAIGRWMVASVPKYGWFVHVRTMDPLPSEKLWKPGTVLQVINP